MADVADTRAFETTKAWKPQIKRDGWAFMFSATVCGFFGKDGCPLLVTESRVGGKEGEPRRKFGGRRKMQSRKCSQHDLA